MQKVSAKTEGEVTPRSKKEICLILHHVDSGHYFGQRDGNIGGDVYRGGGTGLQVPPEIFGKPSISAPLALGPRFSQAREHLKKFDVFYIFF